MVSLMKMRKVYDINRIMLLIFLFINGFSCQDVKAGESIEVDKNELITIQFQDILVRDALQQLAVFEGINIVISDAVSGRITIQLKQVSWQHALDAILRLKKLVKREQHNILIVAPIGEFNKEVLPPNQVTPSVKLEQHFIPINFASADDILSLIKGGEYTQLLSEHGQAAIDKRTNGLLIQDLPENVEAVKELLTLIDVPVKQVQIEAKIVSMNQGNLDELGVRWGLSSHQSGVIVGASIEGNNASNDVNNTAGTLDVERGLNVNFGVASASATSIAFQVATLGKDVLLDLELSALQAESKAEVISTPRLVTTNKSPAYIEQGTEIPYLEAASSGATSVSFKKAVLSLKVTPQITQDNQLILDLLISQDRPGEVVKTGVGEAVAIDTQRVETQVRLNDGETIVLGGVFHHSKLSVTEKVPFIGDVPIVGRLFKRDYQKTEKRELVIFVTPKVINP